MPTPRVPEPLLERLRQGRRFLLTSHRNPDGDAIGSEIGLKRLLHRLGKETTIWNRDPTPAVYRPLPGSEEIHAGPEPPAGFPTAFDAAIVLECTQPDRTGLEGPLESLPLINIDHHLGNEGYGEVDWVDTSAPAVGAMIFRLAAALGLAIDPETADALLLTLVTDTGGFRYSNTTAEAFDAAAELVRHGARPQTVSHWLYESQPEPMLRLLGEMLRTLELHCGGRIATVSLTREMNEKSGARPGDSEGLIDYPRSIAGVEAVALFRQLDEGGFKVSLRSRGRLDVQRIADRFGGGGHKNAAGFSSDLERTRLFDLTLSAMTEALG
jgi:phosphoesterase RecJ-like protein